MNALQRGRKGPPFVVRARRVSLLLILAALTPLVLMWFVAGPLSPCGDLGNRQVLSLVVLFAGGLGVTGTVMLLARRFINETARERKRMQTQIIEAGKMAALGELAGGVAHDINNPLAIMIEEAGWAHDLITDTPHQVSETNTEIVRALEQINRQGVRCKDITSRLLHFIHRTEPLPLPTNLNDLVRETASIVATRGRRGNITLELELQPELPRVCVVPSEIQQVLLNLVTNALHAMGDKGGAVTIGTSLADDWVRLSVRDTGGGIPADVLPHVFEAFYTTKPVGKGTGLGLSICAGIVHALGGEITVDSKVGEGTEFRIALPLQRLRAQDAECDAAGRRGGA